MQYLDKFYSHSPSRVPLNISVGARSSPLSRTQVQEVLKETQQHHPEVCFDVHYVLTTGDRDQQTSLRDLGSTDFFTKEIDELVLTNVCRIGIHSAKDLPIPLTQGLFIICLTKGLDPADVIVLRPGETLDSLPSGSRIATSSVRREENVRILRSDLHFCDLRGSIHERLAKLERGEADGVVVAEAALIRLGLTSLNRMRLPGKTAEGQGQLAIIAKENDREMQQLFSCMDTRKHH